MMHSLLPYLTLSNLLMLLALLTTGIAYAIAIASRLANRWPNNETLHWIAMNGPNVRASIMDVRDVLVSGPHAALGLCSAPGCLNPAQAVVRTCPAHTPPLPTAPIVGLFLILGLFSAPAQALTFSQGPFAGINTVAFERQGAKIVPVVGLPVGGWEFSWTFKDQLQLSLPVAVGLGAMGAPSGTLPVSLAAGVTIGYTATLGKYVVHLALGPAVKLLVLQGDVRGLLVRPDATDFEWLLSVAFPLPVG